MSRSVSRGAYFEGWVERRPLCSVNQTDMHEGDSEGSARLMLESESDADRSLQKSFVYRSSIYQPQSSRTDRQTLTSTNLVARRAQRSSLTSPSISFAPTVARAKESSQHG